MPFFDKWNKYFEMNPVCLTAAGKKSGGGWQKGWNCVRFLLLNLCMVEVTLLGHELQGQRQPATTSGAITLQSWELNCETFQDLINFGSI